MELEKAIEILNTIKFEEDRTMYFIELNRIPNEAKKRYRTAELNSEAIGKVLEELEKQKQIKQEMRKVAFEEGYIQGFNKCREKIMYMEVE